MGSPWDQKKFDVKMEKKNNSLHYIHSWTFPIDTGALVMMKVVDTTCLHSQRLSHQHLRDVTNAYSRHVLPIGWLEAPGDASKATAASTVEWWWHAGCTFSHYSTYLMKGAGSLRLLMYIGAINVVLTTYGRDLCADLRLPCAFSIGNYCRRH